MVYVTNVQRQILTTAIQMLFVLQIVVPVKMDIEVTGKAVQISTNVKKNTMSAEKVDALILKETSIVNAQTVIDLLQPQRNAWMLMNVTNEMDIYCVMELVKPVPIPTVDTHASVST